MAGVTFAALYRYSDFYMALLRKETRWERKKRLWKKGNDIG